MIEVSNVAAQTLQPGQAITFDKVLLHTGCGECHNRMVPTYVKLRCRGVYDIEFHANITGAANAVLQLAIAVDGSAMPQTAMNAVPAAVNNLMNVSAGTFLDTRCCDLDRVSVINTGLVPVTIAPNSSFRIARRA